MPNLAIVGGGGIAEGIQQIVGGDIIPKDMVDVRDPMLSSFLYGYDIGIMTAGISNWGTLKNTSIMGVKEELDVNLFGSFNFAKACINNHINTMIMVGSIAGLYGKPDHAGYCASKAGMRSLLQSLEMEGYNVYLISPGRVDTKMREKDYPNEHKETRLKPIEIGELVKDILDDKYTSGDNIIIRRIGHETQPIVIDRGDGWKERLKVGAPVVC